MLKGCVNGTPLAMICTNGESDAGNCTQTQFVNGMLSVSAILQASYANVKIILVPIGAETNANDGLQTIRQAQQQLASVYPAQFVLAPERADLAVDGTGIHLTDASTKTVGIRTARKLLSVLGYSVSGPVDGSTIVAASRSGTTITCTLAHPSGITDFTPTSAIQGFRFFDGTTSTEIAITAAVRTDATTITLTLASTPTHANDLLYYIYGAMETVNDLTKVIRGNDANTLPLRAFNAVLPYAASTTTLTWGDGTIVTWGDSTQTTWSN